MFAHKHLSSDMEKYICTFLLDGNPNLLYQHQNSTFSIIRSINRATKNLTQPWQAAFDKLKDLLNADSNFKKFYVKTVFSEDKSTLFITKDLLEPVLDELSCRLPSSYLIETLMKVYIECSDWEKESKEILPTEKIKLYKTYTSLDEFRNALYQDKTSIPSLLRMQSEFKFLLFEKMVCLIFKFERKNSNQETNHKIRKIKTSVHTVYANTDCNRIKCLLFACVLPSILIAALSGSLMPESTGRNAAIGFSISFAVLCTCLSSLDFMTHRTKLKRADISQQFRINILAEQLNYENLNQENKTEDRIIEIKEEADDPLKNKNNNLHLPLLSRP